MPDLEHGNCFEQWLTMPDAPAWVLLSHYQEGERENDKRD